MYAAVFRRNKSILFWVLKTQVAVFYENLIFNLNNRRSVVILQPRTLYSEKRVPGAHSTGPCCAGCRTALKTTIFPLSSCSPSHSTELSRLLKCQYYCLYLSRSQVLFFATSYVIPLALICGLYLCMLLRLWRGVAPGGHVSAESRRGKKRVTRMVVVVVAIFAICWFPIQVEYLHIHYSCVVSFIFYHLPQNTQCTFYYVPDYESYTA